MTENSNPTEYGGLLVSVTTLKGLYPVVGATVSVFTGSHNDRQTIRTGLTDQSGRSELFLLPTPDKSLSESAGSKTLPYSNYNLSIKADGYIEHINMNIPIFSGVTSLQNADLTLIAAAGDRLSPDIFNENQGYRL